MRYVRPTPKEKRRKDSFVLRSVIVQAVCIVPGILRCGRFVFAKGGVGYMCPVLFTAVEPSLVVSG